MHSTKGKQGSGGSGSGSVSGSGSGNVEQTAKQWLTGGQKWLKSAGKKIANAAKESASEIQKRLETVDAKVPRGNTRLSRKIWSFVSPLEHVGGTHESGGQQGVTRLLGGRQEYRRGPSSVSSHHIVCAWSFHQRLSAMHYCSPCILLRRV